MAAPAKRVALLGEGLLELHGEPFGTLHQAIGGDTANTAVYLARLLRPQIEVQYLSSVGTDTLSEGMLRCWRSEGIDTSAVLRDSGRRPGLYLVQVDSTGDRSFLYWRSESAARHLLRHPDFDRVLMALSRADVIYLTGISLAILPTKDRTRLIEILARIAATGTPLIFDTNYRPALVSSVASARATVTALLPSVHLALTTFEDEQGLWGDTAPAATIDRMSAAGVKQIGIKLGAAGCLYSDGKTAIEVAPSTTVHAVDTTAAGDAFNAGFVSGWLAGHSPVECCQLGNSLAGTVIQYCGAVIPAAAMPRLSLLIAQERSTKVFAS